ncbi:MAG: ribosome maturation factor RimM [Bacteriovoracaceae bacterium]
MKNKYILLGRVGSVHGVRGEFKLSLENSESSLLKKGLTVFTKAKNTDEYVEQTIKSIRIGNKVILGLEDVDNRNLAEEMTPFEVYIERELFEREKEDGEVYLADLLGYDLVDHGSLKKIGKIEKYYSNGAQDIAVCRLNNGMLKDIPIVEKFFIEIDQDSARIIVDFSSFGVIG